ncbi:MAG: TonB family protein [Acidobacteriota bacterium]
MAQATPTTAPAVSGTDSWLWEVPGGPVSIRLSLDVVDRLDRDTVQAFRAITSRGSEVGGILLGRMAAGGPRTLVIEDYEAVACDYRRGPLYLLADADRRRLEEALERCRAAAGRGLSVVGYYRSNTRQDLALDDDDLEIVTQYFSAPDNVFLLVKPMAGKPNLAGFFVWESGGIERQASRLTFPFSRAELAKLAVSAPAAPAAAAAPAPAPAPAQPVIVAPPGPRGTPIPPAVQEPVEAAATPLLETPLLDGFPEVPEPEPPVAAAAMEPEAAPEEMPAPERHEQPRVPSFLNRVAVPSLVSRLFAAVARLLGVRRFRIGVVAVALAAAGGLLWMPKRGAAPDLGSAVNPSLALKVQRDGGQLVLSWNRNAPGLSTAREAVLSISDGARREDVKVDLALLRAGSLVYSPVSSDVSFRMEVKDQNSGPGLSESVRFPGGQPAPPPQPSGRPQPMVPPEAAATADAEPTPATPPREPPREMILPAGRSADASLAQLEPAEQLAPAAGLPKVDLPAAPARPPPPPPPPPQEAKPAVTENPPAPAATEPAPPAAQQAIRVGGAVQEAKLIRRRTPVYPPLARQARLQGVVRVDAIIGADGRVESVEAVTGPPLLRQAALDAVRQWLYEPSLLNGQPVKVSTQIDVRFTLGQ